jgi:predicted SAM-dependent methyltransferase
MKKLNFGCGNRIAPGWENIDFNPMVSGVRQVNLLRGFPYPDNWFEAVYSSHVLEHFSRADGQNVVAECYRVLRPGGIMRTVLPDLEASCREYLRLLDEVEQSDTARRQYAWIILEMLDQMVRTRSAGDMGAFFAELERNGDRAMAAYVTARTQNTPLQEPKPRSWPEKIAALSAGKIKGRLLHLYARGILRLIPGGLRRMMIDKTPPGEKHRWMYDRYSLKQLMQQAGFRDCRLVSAHESAIPGFAADYLDVNPDGQPYKNISLYCEAIKPA